MSRVASVEEYNAAVRGPKMCVAVFSAAWCDPCKNVALLLAEYAAHGIGSELVQSGTLRIVDVDVETPAGAAICEAEGVETVPHIVFYTFPVGATESRRAAEVSGFREREIRQNLHSLYSWRLPATMQLPMDERIKALLASDRVILFVTGTPSVPRCGFTGKIVELLEKQYPALRYTFFDIMMDDALCQRLKTYSSWPTYPQLYADQQLLGGLDICTEMQQAGELQKVFGPILAAQ